MPSPPVQISPFNIPTEIQYIIDNWFQNNSQLVTGQIGLNVVWNLAKFIQQNPENWNRATVVTDANVNYTTLPSDCIIIFTSNSQGSIDFISNPNIWNKFYIINATDNVRTIAVNNYIDINGNTQDTIPPRSGIYIAKGKDDFWYQIGNLGGTNAGKPPLVGIVDGGGPDDPVSGTSIYQNNKLKGLAQANNQRCQIEIDGGILQNFGNQISFILDNVPGEIDLDPNEFQPGQTLYIDLNQ